MEPPQECPISFRAVAVFETGECSTFGGGKGEHECPDEDRTLEIAVTFDYAAFFDRYTLPKIALTVILLASLVGTRVTTTLSRTAGLTLAVVKWASLRESTSGTPLRPTVRSRNGCRRLLRGHVRSIRAYRRLRHRRADDL